jgi:hypothetical protein
MPVAAVLVLLVKGKLVDVLHWLHLLRTMLKHIGGRLNPWLPGLVCFTVMVQSADRQNEADFLA